MAEKLLLAHAWPGNVRELENVINRARLLAEGDCITVGDLPSPLTDAASARALGEADAGAKGTLHDQLRMLERDIVQRAVEAAGGDRKLAAQRLGIGLSSLYRKLDEREQAE